MVGHQVPLVGNLWNLALHALPAIAYVDTLCKSEFASPGRGALYHGLFAKVQGALLPQWIAGYAHRPDGLDCVVLHGWALIWLGVVVPVWFVAGMERRAWQRWQGRDVGASPWRLLLRFVAAALSPAACLLLAEGILASWVLVAPVLGVAPTIEDSSACPA